MSRCMVFVLLIPFLELGAQEYAGKIAPQLGQTFATQGKAEFLVLMKAQADLGKANSFESKEARAVFVYDRLLRTKRHSQGRVLDLLKEQGVAHRSFLVVNALWVESKMETALDIARLPEVAQLLPNPKTQLDRPAIADKPLSLRNDRDWGLRQVGADAVWRAGITGKGVVIGSQDTGFDWEHPALKGQYRGWDGEMADHNYNWHDAIHELSQLNSDSTGNLGNNPCGLDLKEPCEDLPHGSFTLGIALGEDTEAGILTGMAPDAQWIGCRNMERGWGSPASYLECFEWFLAPTDLRGKNPDSG
ncbi:MAG: S8 family serine peptidase, partial [Saprospiraceae bacterium]|nr:S8 family serine peptidase [Saprospiraceae bacterium]